MSERYWYLKHSRLFEQLDDAVLRQLETRCKSATFPRSNPIYLPADRSAAVFLLVAGRVKICHLTPDGKQSILAFVEPGEVFGELAMWSEGERDEYAEAIEKSTVVQIPGEVMQALMSDHPAWTLGVTKMIGLRRQRIERRLKNLLFMSNRERLTHLLLELVEQYGTEQGNAVELAIKLSHQDLASVIGSTRETVTVVLGELQEEGLIEVGRRRVAILKLERLAKSVSREAPTTPPVEPAIGKHA